MPGAKSRRKSSNATLDRLESRQLLALPSGAEHRFNPDPTRPEIYPSVAVDSQGNYVLAWYTHSGSAASGQIQAQRFNSADQPVGNQFRIDTEGNGAGAPHVAIDADGDFVVAWGGIGAAGDIVVRRFNADGIAQGSEFRVNAVATKHRADLTVAMNAEGDFIVAWTSDQDRYLLDPDVYAKRYDENGTAQGSEFRVNSTSDISHTRPSAGLDQTGAFVIAWAAGPPYSSHDAYARRYDSSGAALGSEFLVFNATTAHQRWPSVAVHPDGDFTVIAWSENGGISAKRFDASGAAEGSEYLIDEGSPYSSNYVFAPILAVNPDGDYVVGWQHRTDNGNLPSSDYDNYARQFNAAGTPVGNIYKVKEGTQYENYLFTFAPSPDGTSINFWPVSLGSSSSELRWRRVKNEALSDRLTVSGTPAADSIVLTFDAFDTVRVSVNGESAYYDRTVYSRFDILAGDGNDIVTINGDIGVYVLGGLGNDTITGSDGNDTLSGAAGNDKITARGGNDYISGGKNADALGGGFGNDTLRGDQSNDSLNGKENDDILYGGDGNDSANGGSDNDLIYGEEGHDLANGDAGNDTIGGANGNDTLNGQDGNDSLNGGNGNDRLSGGTGDNVLHGKGGNDLLIDKPDFGGDIFNGGDGNDSIKGADQFDVIKLIENEIQ